MDFPAERPVDRVVEDAVLQGLGPAASRLASGPSWPRQLGLVRLVRQSLCSGILWSALLEERPQGRQPPVVCGRV
jgi:hypothetical protein